MQEFNQAHRPPGILHSLGSVELGQTGSLMTDGCLPLNKRSSAHWCFFFLVSFYKLHGALESEKLEVASGKSIKKWLTIIFCAKQP